MWQRRLGFCCGLPNVFEQHASFLFILEKEKEAQPCQKYQKNPKVSKSNIEHQQIGTAKITSMMQKVRSGETEDKGRRRLKKLSA